MNKLYISSLQMFSILALLVFAVPKATQAGVERGEPKPVIECLVTRWYSKTAKVDARGRWIADTTQKVRRASAECVKKAAGKKDEVVLQFPEPDPEMDLGGIATIDITKDIQERAFFSSLIRTVNKMLRQHRDSRFLGYKYTYKVYMWGSWIEGGSPPKNW